MRQMRAPRITPTVRPPKYKGLEKLLAKRHASRANLVPCCPSGYSLARYEARDRSVQRPPARYLTMWTCGLAARRAAPGPQLRAAQPHRGDEQATGDRRHTEETGHRAKEEPALGAADPRHAACPKTLPQESLQVWGPGRASHGESGGRSEYGRQTTRDGTVEVRPPWY